MRAHVMSLAPRRVRELTSALLADEVVLALRRREG
jgi:hypothetical protein